MYANLTIKINVERDCNRIRVCRRGKGRRGRRWREEVEGQEGEKGDGDETTGEDLLDFIEEF